MALYQNTNELIGNTTLVKFAHINKEIARKEGIIAGSSSGAAYAAAKKIAQKEVGKKIVVVLPDRGDRYFSTGLWERS